MHDLVGYLRAKSKRCRELADIATNLELRDALDELAGEFERKAMALEQRQSSRRHRRA